MDEKIVLSNEKKILSNLILHYGNLAAEVRKVCRQNADYNTITFWAAERPTRTT